MQAYFNSRDPACKLPFGAVRTGQPVTFVLQVPQSYGVSQPRLMLAPDKQDGAGHVMEKTGTQDNFDIFACTLTVGEAGLYFYWFDLWKDYRKLFCGENGTALETTEIGTSWQLTVFEADYTTPASVRGKVMYQIFPDRFYEGRAQKPSGYPERIYRADKDGIPYFWPTDQKDGYLTRDYFGGDLPGITEKLPYLKLLGIDWIYLNPIVEAHENHRYNTADYMQVDPYLGTNEDFEELCRVAAQHGIRVMLDGVFNHTGADSVYFNKAGRYPTVGAWQSPDSPYRSWFRFHKDGGYDSWWGFDSLPDVDEENPGYRDFICGEGGVIDTWMRRGASGFRLDVADELPDDFIADIRRAVKRHGDDKLLIGEVWEDASNKEAYSQRRRYFSGQELDGVMNYPFMNAILDFMRGGDAGAFAEQVMSLCENYPAPSLAACTTHISTHDTARALTAIVGESSEGRDRAWQSKQRLSDAAYESGMAKLELAFVLQFCLPGVPCVYYGDERGMQGYRDPFNRGYFDWESPPTPLEDLTRRLSRLRHQNPVVFADTGIHFTRAEGGLLCFARGQGADTFEVAVNNTAEPATAVLLGHTVHLPAGGYAWCCSGQRPEGRLLP